MLLFVVVVSLNCVELNDKITEVDRRNEVEEAKKLLVFYNNRRRKREQHTRVFRVPLSLK